MRKIVMVRKIRKMGHSQGVDDCICSDDMYMSMSMGIVFSENLEKSTQYFLESTKIVADDINPKNNIYHLTS